MKNYSVVALALAMVAGAVAAVFCGWSPAESGLTSLVLAAVVQSTYSETQPEATAGMIHSQVTWDGITRVSEDADNIGFGLAVGRGTGDKGCLLGGALPTFLGVSMKDITLVHDPADVYVETDNVGILRLGEIWVQVATAPAASDPVHYNATTGVFGISGGSGPVRGARWIKPGSVDGIALLYVSGDPQAAA